MHYTVMHDGQSGQCKQKEVEKREEIVAINSGRNTASQRHPLLQRRCWRPQRRQRASENEAPHQDGGSEEE